ncbi:TPA: hypothetical protein I7181_06835 [Vibrio vulnificus]|nr:hypothetical protein [Vibrio vulnificus]HAS6237965.1 hypothetical protein [Vibrio vulnificus]HAS6310126.1 hypothetical protein [Vibrio vulnificus]HAT8488586.1 hypothetical protein [Vibrio vulnificus]HAT8513416.1 hypothetical protein [Vibrio vulnificus]
MPKSCLQKILITECSFRDFDPPSLRGNRCIKIKETDPSAKLKEVILKDLSENDICLTFDVGSGDIAKYSPLLNDYTKDDGYTYNKRCDFIIIRILGSSCYVYFGDLKSEAPKREAVFKQLQASKLFFDYIKSIIMLEHPELDILENYIAKYVCYHKKTVRTVRAPIRSVAQRKSLPKSDALKFYPLEVDANGKATTSFNSI